MCLADFFGYAGSAKKMRCDCDPRRHTEKRKPLVWEFLGAQVTESVLRAVCLRIFERTILIPMLCPIPTIQQSQLLGPSSESARHRLYLSNRSHHDLTNVGIKIFFLVRQHPSGDLLAKNAHRSCSLCDSGDRCKYLEGLLHSI